MTTETRVTDETLDALQTARDHAIQQAKIWKMEARSANATIAEIYRLVGSKAGNWNGAEPVRAAITAALPHLDKGGKGEPVAWMIRNKSTCEIYWNEEACVFADAASAGGEAECLNDSASPLWEAFPLHTATTVLPKQITVVSRNLPDGPVWMALAELDEQRGVYVTLDPMYAHPKAGA